MERVGIVGLGAMGSQMLGRLRLAEKDVLTYDVDPAAQEAASAAGARPVASPAEVAAGTELVHVVVRTDKEVMDCTLGPGGIADGVRAGSIILLHSTIDPDTTRSVDAALRPRGVVVLDVCMVGIPSELQAGNETFLVGGTPEDFERVREHLLLIGKRVLHMGPLGAGNVAKLVKNLVTGSERLVIYDALRIAQAAGIRFQDALDMMRAVPTRSLLPDWEKTFDPTASEPLPALGTNIFHKDIPSAVALGRRYGLELPVAEGLGRVAEELVARSLAGH